jgi:hypothetical protein
VVKASQVRRLPSTFPAGWARQYSVLKKPLECEPGLQANRSLAAPLPASGFGSATVPPAPRRFAKAADPRRSALVNRPGLAPRERRSVRRPAARAALSTDCLIKPSSVDRRLIARSRDSGSKFGGSSFKPSHEQSVLLTCRIASGTSPGTRLRASVS